MKKKIIMITTLIGVFLLLGLLTGPLMSEVEKPNYQVIATEENIEIRHYEPMIIAEVEVKGQRKEAINAGFRLLADYIFGKNIRKQDIAMTAPVQQQESQQIAMTAPVQQQESQNIAMTAPVQQQSVGKAWKVSFVMPSEYNMNSLPTPKDVRVRLKQIEAKKFVVIEFSGTNSNENVSKHEQQLLQYIQTHQIKTIDSPKYAFYNPPWTLPLLRRNEVMLQIKE